MSTYIGNLCTCRCIFLRERFVTTRVGAAIEEHGPILIADLNTFKVLE
jgi:hypothetical protein